MAPAAQAADSIYWVNENSSTFSHANLAGGGGGQVPILSPFVTEPIGLGIDAASGKLYWSNVGTDTIGTANLDGSGAGQLNVTGANLDTPTALAIDAAAGRIYWADNNDTTPRISFANLGGGGGGVLNATGGGLESFAIHPAAGKVYWGESEGIRFANLDGGGGGLLALAPVDGLAIDASSNRLYWIDRSTETIQFMSLNGGASGVLDTSGAILQNAAGLAIDPAAGRIYWANFGNERPGPGDDTIGFASLNGGGGGQLDTTGATLDGPAKPVLLKAPVATASPLVKGRNRGGSRLTCEGSSWAGDLPESFLYRAPQTVGFQWLRNGRPIAGATIQSVKANKVGSYACQSIATNFAGSTTATSAVVNVKAALKLGKLQLNPVAGTATLKITAFGAGKLTLTGAGVKRQGVKARPKAQLRILPTPNVKKRLKQVARARVKVKVTFRPSGGKPIRRSKTVVLRKAGLSRP